MLQSITQSYRDKGFAEVEFATKSNKTDYTIVNDFMFYKNELCACYTTQDSSFNLRYNAIPVKYITKVL